MFQRLSSQRDKKYDVNQMILVSLADLQSRTILFSLIRRRKSIEDLARELKLPLSSVYKKISDLEHLSLIELVGETRSFSGKSVKKYQSRISKAEIFIKKKEPQIILYPN